jgi:RNA polymerase sigma-70 factor (ECF subfamily)
MAAMRGTLRSVLALPRAFGPDPLSAVPSLEPIASDASLVEQALAGSERAVTMLYRRHARYVAGVVYRLLGSDAELDDVVQESFCDALAALAELRDPEGFRPWLARIAVRRSYKRLARRRRWRWFVGEAEHVVPAASDPADRERVAALYRALGDLPPNLRIPWTLHVIAGETLPDVATMCDISLATAKRRIAEAAERIDRRLSP